MDFVRRGIYNDSSDRPAILWKLGKNSVVVTVECAAEAKRLHFAGFDGMKLVNHLRYL